MTDEQINISIAESLGWTHCKTIPIKQEHWEISDEPEVARIGCRPPEWGAGSCTFPNYCNDLNAMHEAEGALGMPHERIRYVEELGHIWTGHKDRAIPNWWFVHSATARQRAEAFLRVYGKWEDDA